MQAAPTGHDHDHDHDYEAYLMGKLSKKQADRLWAHLRTCPQCQKKYDDLVRAEAQLGGAGRPLSLMARERVKARVLDRVAPQKSWRPPKWLAAWGGLGLAGAATAALLIFSPNFDDGYQRRGGDPQLSSDLTLRVLRIRPPRKDAALQITELAETTPTVFPGDYVRFVCGNHQKDRTVTLWAIPADKKPRPVAADLALESKANEQRLDVRFVVPDDWPQGPLTWVAVFSNPGDTTPALDDPPRPRDDGPISVRVVTSQLEREASP